MVGINISDQQRALDFYTGKLGFEVHTDLPMGGSQRWIELRVPGSDTHVTLFTPPRHEDRFGSFVNLLFGTEDVEKTFEELRARGVVPLERSCSHDHWCVHPKWPNTWAATRMTHPASPVSIRPIMGVCRTIARAH
jgi:catechol 2,3-dioxygenase-like lactoylglutathione lyase family enzyme